MPLNGLCNYSSIICSHYTQKRYPSEGTPAMHILGFPKLIKDRSVNCLMIGSGVSKKGKIGKCAEEAYDIGVGNY